MATDDVVNKLKKLTEMTRRDFLRGTSATSVPKISGLQSLGKELPLSLDELFKLDAELKKRLLEYTGGGRLQYTISLEDIWDPRVDFRGIEDTLNTPEAEKAGLKYYRDLVVEQRKVDRKIRSVVKSMPVLNPLTKGPSREFWPERLEEQQRKSPEFKSWGTVEKEVSQDKAVRKPKDWSPRTPWRKKRTEKKPPVLTDSPSSKPRPPKKPEIKTKPKEPKRTLEPRITRTASPPPQLPSGKDLSRIALRGAATLAGWPLYAASFGIPSARSGESQVLAELADQPGADVDAALRNYRQRLAQEQQELDLRGELVMSGMP
jgi:hypothetical protein